jgi:hypothetical protein
LSGGTLSVIAYITGLAVVRKILEHLGLPSGLSEPAPARLPRDLSFEFDPDGSGAEDDAAGPVAAGPNGPGPPADDPGL